MLLSQLRITAWELDDPDNGLTSGMIVDLMKSKLGFGDAPTLPEGVDENALVAKFIPRFLANVTKGYNEFLVNMPKILKAIRAQNPTAQIVVLGIFNPVHHSLSLSDGKLPITAWRKERDRLEQEYKTGQAELSPIHAEVKKLWQIKYKVEQVIHEQERQNTVTRQKKQEIEH